MASLQEAQQTATGDVTRTPSRFFELPREMRNQIYRTAFVDDEGTRFKILALEKWMDDERSRRRSHAFRASLGGTIQNRLPLVAKPIPVCPLRQMIISKQFFEEAAEAWLRYKTIQCDDMWTFNKFCKVSRALNAHITKFVCTWNKSAEPIDSIYPGFFSSLKRCSSLRELTVTVTDRVFDIFENRLACVHDFQLDEFDVVLEVENLLEMTSLVSIKLEAQPSELASTDAEKEQWLENVAVFEAHIRRRLSKVGRGKIAAAAEQELARQRRAHALSEQIKAKTMRDSRNPLERLLRFIGWRTANKPLFKVSEKLSDSQPTKNDSIEQLRTQIEDSQFSPRIRASNKRASRLELSRTAGGRVKRPLLKPIKKLPKLSNARSELPSWYLPERRERRINLVNAGVGLAVVLSTANSVALYKLLSS